MKRVKIIGNDSEFKYKKTKYLKIDLINDLKRAKRIINSKHQS